MKASTIILAFLSALSLQLSSCVDREGCTDPASDNFNINAEIDNGTCIPVTAKFLGLYQVDEVCEDGEYSYPMSAYASFADPFEIVLTNYADLGIDVLAVVDRNYLFIPDQSFRIDRDIIDILNGEGEIINGVLSIRYLYGVNGFTSVQCRIDAFL